MVGAAYGRSEDFEQGQTGGAETTAAPALSTAVVNAVNNTDMTIVLAPASQTASVTQATAESNSSQPAPFGLGCAAASLVLLTDALYPSGRLAWASSVNPAEPHTAAGGFVGATAPPEFNFRVDFIEAETGQWLQDDMGSSPNLPALPALAVGTSGNAPVTTLPGSQFGGIEP